MAGRLCLKLSMVLPFTAFAGVAVDSGVWGYLRLHHWFAGRVCHEHGTLARGGRRPVAPIYSGKVQQESSSIAIPTSQ